MFVAVALLRRGFLDQMFDTIGLLDINQLLRDRTTCILWFIVGGIEHFIEFASDMRPEANVANAPQALQSGIFGFAP